MPAENGYSLLTVIVAWYGAILATAIAIWNVKTQRAVARDQKARHDLEDKKARMDAVIEKYMDFRKKHFTEGPDGLQKAGVATLKSDVEIRELADRIIEHNERDPLRRDSDLFMQVIDFKVLFDYAAKERFNFLQGDLAEAIEKSGAKRN